MEWLAGLKELGFPALFSLALLYVLTVKMEEVRKALGELKDTVNKLEDAVNDLCVEGARAKRSEKDG